MSFDEEGDHYMSKADFDMMCDEIKTLKRQRDALEIIAVVVAGALEKVGFTEIDNPADAIEILAKQRDELIPVR